MDVRQQDAGQARARGPAAGVLHAEERHIDLALEDYLWATWRPWEPLPLNEPEPFDRSAALARLAKVKVTGWNWRWERLDLRRLMTTEEAFFWFESMTLVKPRGDERITPQDVAKAMASGSDIRCADPAALTQRMLNYGYSISPHLALPLLNLMPVADFAEMVATMSNEEDCLRYDFLRTTKDVAEYLVHGFRVHALPYLSRADLESLRDRASAIAAGLPRSPQCGEAALTAFQMAACLGCHETSERVVSGWPDDAFASRRLGCPEELVLGLGDASLVEHHMRRLGLMLRKPKWIRAWLAHTEYAALEPIRDAVLAAYNRDDAMELATEFARVWAPEAAPYMLTLRDEGRAPQVARDWLAAHPYHTAIGLAPIAVQHGKPGLSALAHLQRMARAGLKAPIDTALAGLPEDDAVELREQLYDSDEDSVEVMDAATTPTWLAAALAAPAARTKGMWITPAELPAVLADGRRLDPTHMESVLAALRASTADAPHALVVALKANADQTSLDRFAWAVFEAWLRDGGASKEKWAMLAVGLLGSDALALKLTPYIRKWPGESQHARAVFGLDCLRVVNTDTALMQINGIAQKIEFKALKTRAIECMDLIAKGRGLTRAQLEDRIVPDCDLDDRGTRWFDFGPRKFRFVLGPGMKPMVKTEDGQVKPDLPAPNTKDDQQLAPTAVQDWKLLKKQVASVAKIQAVRLEQAMVTGRRWSAEEFELLLVRHPLMTNLVRLLVWGVYDGGLSATFRVTEDLTYADAADNTFSLATGATVGIVHPLSMTPEASGAWGEILSDYEIVQPFPQIGRAIFRLEPAETRQTAIFRYGHLTLNPLSLVGALDRLQYTRGVLGDGGYVYEHSKPFYGANVTAVILYEPGMSVGAYDYADDQRLTSTLFIPGVYLGSECYSDHNNRLTLSEVDPIVISEVLSDLALIASKGK